MCRSGKKAIIIAVKFCHIGRIELQIAAIHAWPLICEVSLKPLTLSLELRNSIYLCWRRWLARILCCELLTLWLLVNPIHLPQGVSQSKTTRKILRVTCHKVAFWTNLIKVKSFRMQKSLNDYVKIIRKGGIWDNLNYWAFILSDICVKKFSL